MLWPVVQIQTQDGVKPAVAPCIISASRSTDIPAFFSEWFINRLGVGYSKWINPFNRKAQYISYQNCRMIVFWSKNPEPLIKHLSYIDAMNIKYYFQFTLNDYEIERLEPNLPKLEERIKTFIKLSELIGKNKVIWRFDPIVVSDTITVDSIINKINYIGDKVHKHTEKLVFSFVDINKYRKVQNNLKKYNMNIRELRENEVYTIAQRVSEINKIHWNLKLGTCAESCDLREFNIQHNKCIDDCLIGKILDDNTIFLNLFNSTQNNAQLTLISDENGSSDVEIYKKLKDTGQRKECGCIFSKDIGQYNTCMHLCSYCYANSSCSLVQKNYSNLSNSSDAIIPD